MVSVVDCVLSMYRALGFSTGEEKEWILEVKLKEERETEERGKGGREGSREGGRSDLLFVFPTFASQSPSTLKAQPFCQDYVSWEEP